MGKASMIPDRRRKRFPLNGGRRLSQAEKDRGHCGIAKVRSALDATDPRPQSEQRILSPHSDKARQRAQKGLDAARAALRDPSDAAAA